MLLSKQPKAILVRRNPCDIPIPGSPKIIARIRAGDPVKQIIEYAPDPKHR